MADEKPKKTIKKDRDKSVDSKAKLGKTKSERPDGGGVAEKKSGKKKVERVSSEAKPATLRADADAGDADDTESTPVDKMRAQLLARGSGAITQMGKMFGILDHDRNRSLDLAEFQKGVDRLGLKISDDEVKAMFEYLDKDESGSIDFDEFLVSLKPPLSKERKDLVLKVFKKLDRTGDGKLTTADLDGVYDATQNPKFLSGELTKEQIFTNFLRTLEAGSKRMDGKVTKQEFVTYYSGISASIDADNYFDTMLRNSWKIE